VARIDHNSEDFVLLKVIIDLASELELVLVAEGIETGEQDRIVRRLGCHRGQGFFFGHPLPVAQRDLAAKPRPAA